MAGMNKLVFASRLFAALLALSFILARTAFSFALPITEFTLDNGLQVIVIEDHRAPVVLHAICYKVGGADETPGKTGLAHFFEHLMFKGTTKYPGDAFDNIMDENGAERNAFTSADVTCYYERAQVSLLGLMMDLDADRMQNLVLTPQVFETERKVVQEERRQQTESSPYAVAGEKLDAALFTRHPYGRPVVGIPEEVEALTLDDANVFYRRHYMPGNAIVLVVGDVQPDEMRTLAERHYGPLKNPGPLPVRNRIPEPNSDTPQRLEMQDHRISDPVFIRKYVMPARGSSSPREAAALTMLSVILGGNSESRFEKQLVVGRRVASAADATYNGAAITYGTYQIYGIPTPGQDVLKLEQDIDAIIADVAKNGIRPDELEWAKNASLAQYIYGLDNPTSFGINIGMALAMGESRADIYNREKVISEVTLEDVQKAARLVMENKHSVTIVLRPKS